jgi:hypothetical protein
MLRKIAELLVVWLRGLSSPISQTVYYRPRGRAIPKPKSPRRSHWECRSRVCSSGHLLTLRGRHRCMDHEPERASDQIPRQRVTCYVPARDHVVGTLSTLVSCGVSCVSPSVHAAWLAALSPARETTP